MSNHPTEPWFIGTSHITNLNICYTDSDCHEVIVASPNFNFINHSSIARRIVACVNACEGIETTRLEMQSLTEGKILGLVRSLKREVSNQKNRYNKLLAAVLVAVDRGIIPDPSANECAADNNAIIGIYDAIAKCGAVNHFPGSAEIVPDGWQLVPMELTGEMNNAAFLAQNSYIDWCDMEAMYRAMLAAAPKFEGGAA